jgi:hypothetical protein
MIPAKLDWMRRNHLLSRGGFRLKIPVLLGVFFILALVVEKVPLDASNPDIELLIKKTSVRYLNYDFRIHCAQSLITVNVKADLEVLHSTHIVYFVLSDFLRARIIDVKVNTYPADIFRQGSLYRIEMPFWYKKGRRLGLDLTYQFPGRNGSRPVLAGLRSDWYPKNLLPELVMARFQLDVPVGEIAIANGQLVRMEQLPNNYVRYHWLQNQPATALAITVGHYEALSREVNGRIFRLFSLPGIPRPFREQLLNWAVRIGDFYHCRFGGDRFADISIVIGDNPEEEASCGSVIFLRYTGEHLDFNRQSPLDTLAHELSHDWWGNQIIPENLNDWWLMEGFANYSALLAMENLGATEPGQAAEIRGMILNRWRRNYQQMLINLEYYKIPEMSLAEIGPFDLQRELHYTKGAFVVHMIRYQLGDEKFFRYLQEFVKRFGGSKAGVRDFTRLGAEMYGADLVDFFRQWVYSAGSYNLVLQDVKLTRLKDGRYRLNLTIANTGQLYLPDRAGLEIITPKKVYSETLRLRQVNVKIHRIMTEKPSKIIINSQNNILEAAINDNFKEIR